jgi:hypothetical protein
MMSFVSGKAKVLPLCLKYENFSFVYNNDLGQVDEPCIFHTLGKIVITRTKKYMLTISINILHLLSFSFH